MSEEFMKKPCAQCPFRRDVKPYLTNARAEELAYHATNRFNTFPCHKTTEYDDDSEDGEMLVTQDSKECAGFLTLMMSEVGETMFEGFEPSYEVCYNESYEMIDAYEEANAK
jgi:plasmid rolling circle replication initiator protein Rep